MSAAAGAADGGRGRGRGRAQAATRSGKAAKPPAAKAEPAKAEPAEAGAAKKGAGVDGMAAALTEAKNKDAASSNPGPVILQPGQIVQGFEIVKPLGKGKFSIVYMAKQLSDGNMCALKKINIFDMMDPKQRDKCLKEVKLLQSLDHPNIVKFLSSFVAENELLIIVEWAEKGDLKRCIRRAIAQDVRFREKELWEYSRQLAGAMDHMHGRRIMHRDLKPANIFVASDGTLKLGDLGLGRFFNVQTLEAFSKVGTPLYMSPEVLHGAGYDMRSDVWSLGCVLYELAMLRSPFKSDQQLSLYDLFVRISKGEYPPLPDHLSPEWRALISTMLQLDPEQRVHCWQVLEVCNAHAQAVAEAAAANARSDPRDAAAGSGGSKSSKQGTSTSSHRISRPSPLLVMDDIVEKLKLLEGEENFLGPRGYPLLHRCFFAQSVVLPSGISQFQVMYDLLQWLLGMLRDRENKAGQQQQEQQVVAADASAGPAPVSVHPAGSGGGGSKVSLPGGVVGAGDAAAGGASSAPAPPPNNKCWALPQWLQEEPAELVRGLVPDLSARGIQVSAEATLVQLRQGHGEGVCFILNELINQELVGRDFHFEAPKWRTSVRDGAPDKLVDEEADPDDDLEFCPEELDGSECSADKASDDGSGASEFSDVYEERRFAAVMPRGKFNTIESVSEAIHVAPQIDPEAWRAELERVKPLLRLSACPSTYAEPGDSSGWQFTLNQARDLGRRIATSEALALVPEGYRNCNRIWHDELSRLRVIENRLNGIYSEQTEKLTALRESAKVEKETVEVLQVNVANLASSAAELDRDVEIAKADLSSHSDNLHDQDQTVRLKQAITKIREESNALEVRTRCLQSELLARSLKAPRPTTENSSDEAS